MKFRCERDVLVEALTIVSRAVSSRGGSLPVLTGVRAQLQGDELRLTGTDLELTIVNTITVAGPGDGTAVIPARLFSDVVRSLGAGAVSVSVDDDSAQITAGRSDFSLRVIPPEEFPRPTEPEGAAVSLPARSFAQALRQVVPAASSDDAKKSRAGRP